MKRAELKREARKSLKGNHGIAIAVTAIYAMFIMLATSFGVILEQNWVTVSLTYIITALFYMGVLNIMLRISRGKKATIGDFTSKIELFWQQLTISLVVTLVLFLFYLLEQIAFSSLSYCIMISDFISMPLATTLIGVGLLLTTLLIMIMIMISISFSQVYFILLDEPEMDAIDIIKGSSTIMYEHKFEYLKLMLSFIGWIIIGIITCGFGLLFIYPYMMVTYAKFYDALEKEEVNEETNEKIQERTIPEVVLEPSIINHEDIKNAKKEIELNQKTVIELKEMAREKKIKGFSMMKKEELIQRLK